MINLRMVGVIFGFFILSAAYCRTGVLAAESKNAVSPARESLSKPQQDAGRGPEAAIKELQDQLAAVQKERDALKELNRQINTKNSFLQDRLIMVEALLMTKAGEIRSPQRIAAEEANLDKQVWLNLAYAYARKGEIETALQYYRKAQELDPGDKNINYNIGYILGKLHKYDEAIAEYKKAIKGAPEDREVYYNLGLIYADGLNDRASSDEYFQRYLKISSVTADQF